MSYPDPEFGVIELDDDIKKFSYYYLFSTETGEEFEKTEQ